MRTVAIILRVILGYAGLVFILALPFLFAPDWWILALFVGIPALFALTLVYGLTGEVPWEIAPILALVLADDLAAVLVR